MTTQTHDDTEFLAMIGAKVGEFEFTIGELREAFDRVATPANWKGPIDTTVEIRTERENQLIREAVKFMTGSVATLYVTDVENVYKIEAAGYYAAVGA